MNFSTIKKRDVANGPGVRVSLFVSGCTHHCLGCFNEETWDFSYGSLFTAETEAEIIKELSFSFIAGLSLLGGEPFEPANQEGLLPLLRKVKAAYPEKDVWCYTGYLFEKDILQMAKESETTQEMLKRIDVLVDGPFLLEKKSLMLSFRGSSNQRIIQVPESLETGQTVLHPIHHDHTRG